MPGMNWRRSHYQTRMRDHGAVSVADDKDRFGRDRAARWLERRKGNRQAEREAARKARRVARSGHTVSCSAAPVMHPDPADPNERPPWE